MEESGELVIPERRGVILNVSDACRFLAQARNIDEVKEVRDRGLAFAHYAREQKLGKQAEIDACEIRVRAERRMGQLLAERDTAPHGGDRKTDSRFQSGTLKDDGITKQDSHRWQRMAGVDDESFEQYLSETRTAAKAPSTAAVLKLVPKPEAQSEKAFDALRESEVIEKWLRKRLDSWPENARGGFADLIRHIVSLIEEDDQ